MTHSRTVSKWWSARKNMYPLPARSAVPVVHRRKIIPRHAIIYPADAEHDRWYRGSAVRAARRPPFASRSCRRHFGLRHTPAGWPKGLERCREGAPRKQRQRSQIDSCATDAVSSKQPHRLTTIAAVYLHDTACMLQWNAARWIMSKM